MSRPSTSLTAQPCPFCGGPPAAMRVPPARPKGTRTDIVIGCSAERTCDATITVRGTSFGDAVMRWNLRHVYAANGYRLHPPSAEQPITIGEIDKGDSK